MYVSHFARTIFRAFSVSAIVAGCTTGDKAAEKTALSQYAPRSPDAAIKAVSLSSSDREAFDPARAGTTYPDTTRRVVVWYRWAGADPAAKVDIHWFKGNEKVLEQGEAFAKPSGSSAWVLKMDAGGTLPADNYRVDLLENGKQVTSIPFQVGAEQTASTTTGADGSEAGAEPAPVDTPPAAPTSAAPADTTSAAPGDTTSSSPAAASAPAETTRAEPPAAAPSAAAGETAAKGLETKWPGVFAEVTEFKRKGNTLTVKVRFTNHGSKPEEPDIRYNETYLLDANNKKYEALKDEQGRYLAALRSGYPDRWYDKVEPGGSQSIWMKFSAPAAATKTVSLQLPGMEPFEELAIQDAP
jgi:hypothetical protein